MRGKKKNPYSGASSRLLLFIGLGFSAFGFVCTIFAGIAAVAMHLLIEEMEHELVISGTREYAFYVLALVGFFLTICVMANILKFVVAMKSVRWLVGTQSMVLDEIIHLLGNCSLVCHGVDFANLAKASRFPGVKLSSIADSRLSSVPSQEMPVMSRLPGRPRGYPSARTGRTASTEEGEKEKHGPFLFGSPADLVERRRPVDGGMIGLGVDENGHWSYRANISVIRTACRLSPILEDGWYL